MRLVEVQRKSLCGICHYHVFAHTFEGWNK
jgi:hypothetical protein